jgi:hypothetical protein
MKRLPALILAAFAVIAANSAGAQNGARSARARDAIDPGDDYLDRTPTTCISLSLLRDTEVLDDGTILFYMRGRNVYVNVLDRPCIGLESAGRFSTQTRTNRLCSVDMLQVFRQLGSSVMPGAFCRLGEFYPITRAEAELLELEPDELNAVRRSVVLTQLPPEEVAAADASEKAGP